MSVDPKWIAPRLCCGLGNRLFQTMAAIGEAERCGATPVLFLPRSTRSEHGETAFFRELFKHLKVVETAGSWEELEEDRNGRVPPIHAFPLVLKGFFQNSSNFPSYSNPNWPKLPFSSSAPLAAPLAAPLIRWAIHFRLGDYKILPHHQSPLIEVFYGHTIKTRIPKGSEILLVSDSPEALSAIQQELEGDYKPRICKASSVKETFLEVLECSGGLIGSNSTFSWWLAYFLWRASGATSYFPEKWFGDGRPGPDILNTPFTQVVPLSECQKENLLKSFRY